MAEENPEPPPLSLPTAAGACCVTQGSFSMVFQPHPLILMAGRCLCPAGGPGKAPELGALRAPQLSKAPSWGWKNRCPSESWPCSPQTLVLFYSCCLFVDIGKICFKFECI